MGWGVGGTCHLHTVTPSLRKEFKKYIFSISVGVGISSGALMSQLLRQNYSFGKIFIAFLLVPL